MKTEKQFQLTTSSEFAIPSYKIGLKAQMACNVCRQVAGTYKSMKSNGEWKLAEFDAKSMVLSYGRDFSFKREYLSITTLDGRKKYKLIT